ncbi:MAG: ATP-dependent Clp protease adaptor ClpS [Lachnospiraceae bacterium]|nr:ATP-dependent Clp protease adaptor ClpS [Lachnospiraceae bacterium]
MPTKSETKERTVTKLKEPKRYHVIMLNDDFTTMEFVVEILIEIFHKDPATAERLMMSVHKSGSAIVGTYSHDIAVTKVNKAMARAKEQGYPFRMKVEEA